MRLEIEYFFKLTMAGFFLRGVQNAFRSSLRTIAVVLILGLSLGLALTMAAGRSAVMAKIASVKANVGTNIAVSPAGFRGQFGGGEPLTQDDLTAISQLPNVKSVQATVTDNLATGDTTSLASAVELGTLGQREGRRQFRAIGSGRGPNGTTFDPSTFKPPILAVGTSDATTVNQFGLTTITISDGVKFANDSDENVAVLGQALAEKNSLKVGSTFKAYNQDVTVTGIFSSDTTFGDNLVVFPLTTLRRLATLGNEVTAMTVEATNIDTIQGVVAAVKEKLGTRADVTSELERATQSIEPLQNISRISMLSLIGALAASGVIVFLVMLVVVRDRRREIGILKAIGVANHQAVLQSMAEGVTLTLMGTIAGIAVGIAASQPVLRVLLRNAATPDPTPGASGFARGGFQAIRLGGQRLIDGVQAAVTWEMILIGLGVAIVIALIGSAVPAYLTARIRPAEVLRGE